MSTPGVDRNHPFLVLLPLGLVLFCLVSLGVDARSMRVSSSDVTQLAISMGLFMICLVGRTDLSPRLQQTLRWGTWVFIVVALVGIIWLKFAS